MEKELIYIGSVNRAIKAREILRKNGIFSQIERGMQGAKGCSYSVLIVSGSAARARMILSKFGLIDEFSPGWKE